jgi:hypothetical protein
MHESGEGCTFLSALAFIAKFVFMWGPRGHEPRKGENTAGGVGDGEDMGGLRCALSIIA